MAGQTILKNLFSKILEIYIVCVVYLMSLGIPVKCSLVYIVGLEFGQAGWRVEVGPKVLEIHSTSTS